MHNPWTVDHITGGSSSGSGSAVAARLTFAALGSDTGGSVRMPAHFCGVTGLKTTVGRVSRAGAMPLSQSLDTVGPLARTAQDCALLLGLMAGADPDDPTAPRRRCRITWRRRNNPMKGLTIGVPTAFYVDDLDPEVARILDETIAVLKREGARIVQVELPDQRQLTAACQFVLAVEAAAFHKRWMIERPQDYGPQVLMRLQNGLAIPGVTYLEAMRWRGPALAAHLAAVAGVDAVIAPVAPVAAPTIAESDVGNSPDAEAVIQRLTRFTRPVNYLGLPSLAIPSGFTPKGLPVGMQLIGRPFDEAMLLRIGAAFQRATDFHARLPRWKRHDHWSGDVGDRVRDQPPRPGSAQRSIWEAPTICLGWCGLSVPALADQPFARICMANSLASTSDLNVRVDRTAPLALSSVFTVLSGPKATYQISGCVMAA